MTLPLLVLAILVMTTTTILFFTIHLYTGAETLGVMTLSMVHFERNRPLKTICCTVLRRP